MLGPGTPYFWCIHREEELIHYGCKEDPLVYCDNFPELVHKFGLSEYYPSEWKLFIDASKRSLKGVLFHNENVFCLLPVTHSVILKESYENLDTLLSWIKYQKHKWQV